jgi:hypothetical protein
MFQGGRHGLLCRDTYRTPAQTQTHANAQQNRRSSAAEAFRAVLDIAEAARGRRAARRTHSKEHRDPTLSRLLGRDGGSFAGGLRGEMKRLDAAGALEEVFAELIAARKSKGGE